jgi:hypothetical protein
LFFMETSFRAESNAMASGVRWIASGLGRPLREPQLSFHSSWTVIYLGDRAAMIEEFRGGLG